MGLGDTNYDQFCHMGKMIDKRLKELGGNRFHPLCCADEATGLEETVEGWKDEIMDLLCQLDELIAASAAKTAKASDMVQAFETFSVVEKPLVNDAWIPCGLINLSGVADWLQLTSLIQSPPESSQLPNSKKVLFNGPLVNLDVAVNNIMTENNVIPADGWTAGTPFLAPITSARWLTSICNNNESESCWGDMKRVIHMDLNLSSSGIEYLPGDSIGICCQNPSSLVDAILLRLRCSHPESNLTLDSPVSITSNGIEESCTLKEILTYK